MRKGLITVMALVFGLNGIGQSGITDTIEVSLDFNVFLMFESNDISFNFASPDIKVSQSDNKLIVEGLLEDFYTTNMLVESDNKYYMFILKYSEIPKQLIFDYQKSNNVTEEKSAHILVDSSGIRSDMKVIAEKDSIKSAYDKYVDKINAEPQKIHAIGSVNYMITAIVTNVNIINDKTVIKVNYLNKSDIDYEMDFFEMVVTDKINKVKKNATQELQIDILYRSSLSEVIEAKSQLEVVYIIDKLTISKKKQLVIRVIERNENRQGDRGIVVNIPFKYITKASAL